MHRLAFFRCTFFFSRFFLSCLVMETSSSPQDVTHPPVPLIVLLTTPGEGRRLHFYCFLCLFSSSLCTANARGCTVTIPVVWAIIVGWEWQVSDYPPIPKDNKFTNGKTFDIFENLRMLLGSLGVHGSGAIQYQYTWLHCPHALQSCTHRYWYPLM